MTTVISSFATYADCLCITCCGARYRELSSEERLKYPFRYACEICGNKRCPHHTDHRLECSGSNLPGQPGSVFR